MAKSKHKQYQQLLQDIFTELEQSGNLIDIATGTTQDLVCSNGHQLLEHKREFKRIRDLRS